MEKFIKWSALVLLSLTLILPSAALAADFDWTRDLNVRAQADPSGFRAQLSTRFKIGDAQIKVVLGNVESPSDAYMVFRLGEMSSRPVDYVLNQYRAKKNKGWGALAQSLGIKPGSSEFKALKQGSSLYGSKSKSKDKGNKKSKKDKGKNGKG